MESAQTSKQKTRLWAWTDATFEQIIDATLSSTDAVIKDISSPPGTRKTYNVLRYIINNALDAIAAFPNHQNQQTALQYILSILEEKKPRRLRQFVFDYAGLENYCIFYSPQRLRKLLDKFRSKGEDYRTAAQNLLGHPEVFMVIEDWEAVESAWLTIAEALEEYLNTRDKSRYLSRIKEIVERKSQYEICKSVCPIGLFASKYRRELYKLFEQPKIITWRTELYKEISDTVSNYPYTSRHVVLANPSVFLEHLDEILSGKAKAEWLLCPRYLLMFKVTTSGKTPVYISTRKSIILTPHSGLDFVMAVVSRQNAITKTNRVYTLYLDEYDTLLLRPKTWPLIPLDVIRTAIAVSERIITAPRDEIDGVTVDEYLRRYAGYVKEVLTRFLERVEKAIETGEYDALASITLEGAFSEFKETKLKTSVPITYKPLGARVMHIKHFTGDNLISLILNEKVYFRDLADRDKEWRLYLRDAKLRYRKILSKARVLALQPVRAPRRSERTIVPALSLARMEIEAFDPLPIIRDYVKQILLAPRLALFYIHGKAGGRDVVRLASIDVRIFTLFAWARNAILTSATPVHWPALVAGPNTTGVASSDYERVTLDIAHSMLLVEPPERLNFTKREETLYIIHYTVYTRDYLDAIYTSIASGAPIEYRRDGITRITSMIKQVSPLTKTIREYSSLLRVVFSPALRPLYKPRTALRDRNQILEEAKKVKESLKPYLASLSIRYSMGDTILVLAQNKDYARLLKISLGGVKCRGSVCNEDVRKISHYLAKNRIVITWFRSRAGRGIDLPYDFDSVIVLGSPYPRPQTIAYYRSELGSAYGTKLSINMNIEAYNTRTVYQATKTLTPPDIMNGIAELVQSVGRATRSAMRTGRPVTVILGDFLHTKIHAFAPVWFLSATVGVVPES